MATTPYKPPTFGDGAFNCPHCTAFSRHIWTKLHISQSGYYQEFNDLIMAYCTHCEKYSLWHFTKMIYPPTGFIEPVNSDLPTEIQEDYHEAASIINQSPRGAAALLRLCIQKLCIQLEEKGDNINTDIAELVKKGLPVRIQQALDIVRVIGNDAVHPGMLDIKDDIETATKLFTLINMIAYNRLTEPREISEMYDKLPQTKKDAIDKRDKKSSS